MIFSKSTFPQKTKAARLPGRLYTNILDLKLGLIVKIPVRFAVKTAGSVVLPIKDAIGF